MLVPEEIAMQAQEDRRQQMLELARQWRDSGLNARAFAEGHGVTPWTLYYWRERLTKPERRRRRQGRRSEEHTSELQSRFDLVCRLLLEKKKKNRRSTT